VCVVVNQGFFDQKVHLPLAQRKGFALSSPRGEAVGHCRRHEGDKLPVLVRINRFFIFIPREEEVGQRGTHHFGDFGEVKIDDLAIGHDLDGAGQLFGGKLLVFSN